MRSWATTTVMSAPAPGSYVTGFRPSKSARARATSGRPVRSITVVVCASRRAASTRTIRNPNRSNRCAVWRASPGTPLAFSTSTAMDASVCGFTPTNISATTCRIWASST